MNKNRLLTGMIVFAVLSMVAYISFHVTIVTAANSVAILKTDGMTCLSCSEKIRAALKRVKGVAACEVNMEDGRLVVGFDNQAISADELATRISSIGFKSCVEQQLTPEQYQQLTGRELDGAAGGSCKCCTEYTKNRE